MEESRNTELLRLPAVCAQTGLKRTQLYELIKRGEFPASIRISLRSVAWVRADVERWIHERIAAAQAQRARTGAA
jgi:prophage regulatory protein